VFIAQYRVLRDIECEVGGYCWNTRIGVKFPGTISLSWYDSLWALIHSLIMLCTIISEHSHSHGETSPSKSKANQTVAKSPTEPPVAVTANETTVPEGVIHSRSDSFTDLYGHPAATRASVVQAAQDIGYGRPVSPLQHKGRISIDHDGSSSAPLAHEQSRKDIKASQRPQNVLIDIMEGSTLDSENNDGTQDELETPPNDQKLHYTHTGGSHSGSHGSMNMHALILHVIGDALGNVGVISTGLVIWLSNWTYKYYFDPIISLVITVIIFSSALPLGWSISIYHYSGVIDFVKVRSASFILLQAVPSTISLENIRGDIQQVDGVLSVHELHVWQLSEDKIVASVHVWVSRKREYMLLAHDIRKILHDHGVHSSTIQPEFHGPDDAPFEEDLIVRTVLNFTCVYQQVFRPAWKPIA
jgi:solute carrier family 30 (zinc transporter), member 1